MHFYASTRRIPDATPYYALVYLFEDLDGNVEINNITTLDIAELATSK